MKVIRIKYVPPLTLMIQDLERVFPNYAPITATLLGSLGGFLFNPIKKRFVFVKEKFQNGVRTHVIVYALVRDSFVVPNWVQGTELDPLDPVDVIDHWFMGHEVPTPDDPNEPLEEEIL